MHERSEERKWWERENEHILGYRDKKKIKLTKEMSAYLNDNKIDNNKCWATVSIRHIRVANEQKRQKKTSNNNKNTNDERKKKREGFNGNGDTTQFLVWTESTAQWICQHLTQLCVVAKLWIDKWKVTDINGNIHSITFGIVGFFLCATLIAFFLFRVLYVCFHYIRVLQRKHKTDSFFNVCSGVKQIRPSSTHTHTHKRCFWYFNTIALRFGRETHRTHTHTHTTLSVNGESDLL